MFQGKKIWETCCNLPCPSVDFLRRRLRWQTSLHRCSREARCFGLQRRSDAASTHRNRRIILSTHNRGRGLVNGVMIRLYITYEASPKVCTTCCGRHLPPSGPQRLQHPWKIETPFHSAKAAAFHSRIESNDRDFIAVRQTGPEAWADSAVANSNYTFRHSGTCPNYAQIISIRKSKLIAMEQKILHSNSQN